MRKKDQSEMEKRISEATRIEDPREEFIESLHQRITGQGAPSTGLVRLWSLSHRSVWFFIVIGIVLISTIYFVIGPKNVHAFIEDFNFLDSGLETVEEAGMVTELGATSLSTILYPNSTLEEIIVILDWVYIDESRLVLGFITESMPSGLILGVPTIIAEDSLNQNLVFSSISVERNKDQIVFMTFNPIQTGNNEKRVDFSVDIPLVESADSNKTPLVVFHYDLEAIPVRRGITYEFDQSSPAMDDDLGFSMESILVTPSFSKISFCVDMPVEDILALPKPAMYLQIDDGPAIYNYYLVGLSEAEGQACVQIGFSESGLLGNERITFKFQWYVITIGEYSGYDLNDIIEKKNSN